MQFLKLLLIVLTVGLAVAFAFNNWKTVDITLWGGMIAEVNLPLLMTTCFLAGLIPTWLWHRAVRWRLNQRLTGSERVITDLRAVNAASATPAVSDTAPVVEPAAVPAAPPLIDGARS